MRVPGILLALCLAGPAAAQGSRGAAPQVGAPTEEERAALVAGIAACWNVGGLSEEAARATVTVGFDVDPDRTPVAESVALLAHDTTEAAAAEAFAAARRAILRCGASGLPLPSDTHEAWREMEVTFSPRADR